MRATLPLIDPITDEFVAESLLEFSAEYFAEFMSPQRAPLHAGAFPVVLSSYRNKRGANTIYAPGVSFGQEVLAIEEYLLKNDECTDFFGYSEGCARRAAFQDVFQVTQLRRSGRGQFTRSDENHNPEQVTFGYAPVVVTTHKPVDPSDFSRGVERFEETVFSLWICQTQEGVETTVKRTRDVMIRISNISLVILGVVSMSAFLIVLYISARVSIFITVPVSQLHSWLERVNEYALYPRPDAPSFVVTHIFFTVCLFV
mmetsp:Transcript_3293/g.7300  ORF Transcript_3293/g.7300 Transcript_3293/m.7300 type:complete len:258 (+) Transcript_3293:154-927(+)